jgi:hypothetical protein
LALALVVVATAAACRASGTHDREGKGGAAAEELRKGSKPDG